MPWNKPEVEGNRCKAQSFRPATDSTGTRNRPEWGIVRAFFRASTSGAEVAMYSHRPLSIQRVTDTGGSTPCEKSLRPRRIGSFSSLSQNVVQHGPQWCSRGPGPTDLARYAESFSGSPRQGKAPAITSSIPLRSIWAD
jgi:hypothetical protein